MVIILTHPQHGPNMSFFTRAPWPDDPRPDSASHSSQDHPRKGCTADQNQSLICGSPKMWEKYGEIANTSNMCFALLGHVYHLLSVVTCYNHLYAPNGNLKHSEPFEVDKDAVKQWQRFFVFFVFFRGWNGGAVVSHWHGKTSLAKCPWHWLCRSPVRILFWHNTETAVKPEIDSHNIATQKQVEGHTFPAKSNKHSILGIASGYQTLQWKLHNV